jgi:hypothetical protein
MKKLVVLFSAPGFTSKNYDQVWESLRLAGHANPDGLLSHVGFSKPDGSWNVVDIWESQEAFDKFSSVLLPILEKTGANVPPPHVYPAYFVQINQKELA